MTSALRQLPVEISRSRYRHLVQSLGLRLDDLLSLRMTPTHIEAEVYSRTQEGRRSINGDGPETSTVHIPIRDQEPTLPPPEHPPWPENRWPTGVELASFAASRNPDQKVDDYLQQLLSLAQDGSMCFQQNHEGLRARVDSLSTHHRALSSELRNLILDLSVSPADEMRTLGKRLARILNEHRADQ